MSSTIAEDSELGHTLGFECNIEIMITEIGVAVIAGFVGAIISGFVVRPVREYREVRKKIAKDLIMYANLITSPGSGSQNKMDEASYEIRKDAAELRAVIEDIPFYYLWFLFRVPAPTTLESVEGRLIRLSNSIHSGDTVKNQEDKEEIKQLLNIGG